ncbi:MAG: Hpt domain-containing protein, partial [Gammaproteobacteria bacterium]|nr:Hpt domain-containing protein [Gammaproteobacteria bacterium]
KGVYAVTAGGDEFGFIPKGESLSSIGFSQWFVKPVSNDKIVTLLNAHSTGDSLEDKGGPPLVLSPSQNSGTLVPSPKEAKRREADKADSWDTLSMIPAEFEALLSPFMKEMTEGMAQLAEHIDACDWLALKSKAHYLKGNCMLFQLNHTVDLFRKIEQCIKEVINPDEKQARLKILLNNLNLAFKRLEK